MAADAITTLVAEAGRSAGALFLARGSTYSLPALGCSLALALTLAVPRGRRRPVRSRVVWRALFGRRLYRHASGRADIGWFMAGVLFPGLLVGWALLSQARLAHAIVARCGGGAALLPAPLAAAILTVAGFLAYELGYWIDHRLKHAVPALWHFHAVHHSAEHLSLLTNHRVHPVDTIIFLNIVAVVTGTVGGGVAVLLGGGAAGWTVGGTNALGMLAAIAIGHLQHSHFWVRFGPRWGRRLLGPAHHQLHHSADPAHHGRNLGNIVALWDRLFGTFLMPPATRPRLRFGVDGLAAPHGLRAALVTPWVGAWRSLARAHPRRSGGVASATSSATASASGSTRWP